jgi:hypothetical protein
LIGKNDDYFFYKLRKLGKKEFLKYLDKYSNERLRMKIIIENGKVTDIVVQYESLLEGKWVGIVRYDCAHGFLHRDVIYPNGEIEKQVIDFNNLEMALTYAEQDFKDRWEFYKNRFMKKLKK